eukprot:gb/GEZN01001950.1/.p1 GENE.gb/GEZN01001950.1/~~gb/GEZN01001950.1/.p1  ORF type:complete len:758 (+),score=48.66 gb/GEZN01001950.1/:221-2494(+)
MRESRVVKVAEALGDVGSWSIMKGPSHWFKSRYPAAHRGASDPGSMYHFPWECLGSRGKLVLFLPLILVVAFGIDDEDRWCYHMLLVAVLRYIHAFAWNAIARSPSLTAKTRITAKRVEFKQVDREENWDDYIILQMLVATLVHLLPALYCYNGVCQKFANFPYNTTQTGWLQLYLWHAGPTEAIYYCLHRALHDHRWYAAYHSHHHASFTTEPISGSVHPFAEHLMYTVNFALPLLGTWLTGGFSISVLYAYLLGFDFLNCLGHCNFEFIPPLLYKFFPPLKYLIYTPTFHALHHSKVRCNYALFMPLYDYLGGTVEPTSWALHEAAWAGKAGAITTGDAEPPQAIFLGHGMDLASTFHLPWMSRTLSCQPWALPGWVQPLLWPFALPFVVFVRWRGKSLAHSRYQLHHPKDKNGDKPKPMNVEIRATPAIAIQFAFKREWNYINGSIEKAILDADKAGVKVFGLGAMNKNEALNGGGALFTKRNPNLSLRLVHGNTLTAAAVLAKIPNYTKTAFCCGATSKLGRAISIYMALRGVRMLLLTSSKERFNKLRKDAMDMAARRGLSPAAVQTVGDNLVHTERLEDGADCNTWVVGRPLTFTEQSIAPVGSTFHQFVVPPLELTGPIRKDCQYSQLPAFKLPAARTKGVRACEMSLDRGVVHACHAGMLVHALEKWEHHEVGAVDPAKIDICWEAARVHGFDVTYESWADVESPSLLDVPLMTDNNVSRIRSSNNNKNMNGSNNVNGSDKTSKAGKAE